MTEQQKPENLTDSEKNQWCEIYMYQLSQNKDAQIARTRADAFINDLRERYTPKSDEERGFHHLGNRRSR